VLSAYRAFVTYVPMRPEPPLFDYLTLPKEAAEYKITPRATLDPQKEAKAARLATRAVPTAVLIPGRMFDARGTRYGQGGGWYDRFLSYVPKTWLRVGFCYPHQFSEEDLVPQPWDQPMDYVCLVDGENLIVYKTNARGI